MTTVGVNVGDEFIREGICSFIDQLLPTWQPFYVNKHDLTSLHTRIYDEPLLLADKFKDADIIIQAGAPVYWRIGDSTSYNVEWAEELWRKRIFRLGPEKLILNVAAGACQPYPDTPQTFLADPLCVDFANRAAAACRWTSVRDPLAAQILLALGHDHAALPCSAFHAARRVKTPVATENMIGINLMPLGGHFQLRQDVDQGAWRKIIAEFLDGARAHQRLLFIAHDRQELSFMEGLRQGDEQVFFSPDYRDYFQIYARCKAVVANRVHGAVCAAGFGTPSMIIGNDTRLMIGDFIGLPSFYVAEVTAAGMLDRLDALLTMREIEQERLLTLREESARVYVATLAEVFASAGIDLAVKNTQAWAGLFKEHGCTSSRSIQLTISSFAKRLSLDPPDFSLAGIIKELLSRPERRNLIRSGGTVLVIGNNACPLAWFLATLGARVTFAEVNSERACEGLPAGFSQFDGLVSRVAMGDGKIAMEDNSFDMAVVCVEGRGVALEALRLLRPTGIGIMPQDDQFEMIGQKTIAQEKNTVVGCKALPLRQKARILIPRFDTFGDIVLFEGFVAALCRKFPDAELCMLVRKGYDDLARLFPAELSLRWATVDQQAYIPPTDQQRADFCRTLKRLAGEGWDAVLVATFNRTWLDEILLEEFVGVDTVMLGSAADARKLCTTRRAVVPVEEWAHETEKYRVLLEGVAGDRVDYLTPQLVVSAALAEEAVKELSRLDLSGRRFVACLPAGTQNYKYKVWPLERYAEVLDWLHERQGLVPLLVGHEREDALIRSLAGMLAASGIEARTWLGQDGSIPMLGGLLQKAALFIGNDSGPMHIAAALKVPVVGVFGGGYGVRFAPANTQTMAVFAEIPCFGCCWQCIFGDAPCMRLVDVESVKRAIGLVTKNEAPASRLLNVGEQLPIELIEIIERAKAALSIRGSREEMLREALKQEQAKSESWRKTLSWRLTAPLRKLVARMKFV